MTMNFDELEDALYHIRVNHLYGYMNSKSRIQFSACGNGDTDIKVWDENLKLIGHFRLSTLIEELALLRADKLTFGDLYANIVEEEDED